MGWSVLGVGGDVGDVFSYIWGMIALLEKFDFFGGILGEV
jgi:hypothetical protein